MFFKNTFIYSVCTLLVLCEAAFVDNIKKCSVSDSTCGRDLLQGIFRDVAKTGIPEYEIPPFDPYHLTNITVSIKDIVDITIVDGIAKGIKSCVVRKFHLNIEKGTASNEMLCNITIKGKYKAFGDSPLFQNLLGGATIHGDGNAKLVIEKLDMKFDHKIRILRRNEDLFIDSIGNRIKYTADVGKITFAANNLYLGEREASNLIVAALNDNWRFIIQSFGKPFLDKAMDIINSEIRKFFDRVPTKYYLIDDLSPYVYED